MRKTLRHILLFLGLSVTSVLHAQMTPREALEKGNEHFENEHYALAMIQYELAIGLDEFYGEAHYNMGVCKLKLEDKEAAMTHFEKAAEFIEDKSLKSQAYHNLGTTQLNEAIRHKEQPPMNMNGQAENPYQEHLTNSIESLQSALINNPADGESRYNLAMAKKLMKELEEQQQQQDEQQQDENEQQQDQQQNQDNQQDEQDQQNQQQDQQEQDQQDQQQNEQQQEQQSKPLTKQEAQQLLDAIEQQEKDLRKQMNIKRSRGKITKTDKDW